MKNITKRETILIIILLNLIGYYFLFNILILPTISTNKQKNIEIEEMQAQKQIKQIENQKLEADLKNLKDSEKNHKEIYDIFFSTANEENIHYFLNQIANKTKTTINSFKIEKNIFENDILENIENNEINAEDIENNIQNQENALNLKKYIYKIEIELYGDFENKVNFLKYLENLNKSIKVCAFDFFDLKNNSNSNLFINIYSIEKENLDEEFQIK